MIDFALSFLMTSATMSLIIITVLVVGNMFPKIFTAKLRYMAWVIVLVGLIIPIRPSIGTGLIYVPVQTQAVSENRQHVTTNAVIPGTVTHNIEPGFYSQITAVQTSDANILVDVLLFLWLIPAVVIFGYHLLKYAKFNQLIKRWSTPISHKETIAIFENIKSQKKIRRNIALKKCKFVSTSMLIGFCRPVILLPEKDFDTEELSLIFLHELTHYKRGDLFIKLVSVAVSSLHWFNPAVYFMSAAMQTDCEASCDETVLQEIGGDNRQFYAELIMEMIGGKKKQGTLLSTCFFASTRGIKVRMGAIMDAKKTIRGLSTATLAVLVFPIMLSGSVFAITPLPHTIPVYPGIGLIQAREIALSVVENGTLERIEAGYVDGGLILGVAVSQQDRMYRMILDASNGAILRLHIQSPNETHGISLSQAIQIAHNDLIERGISAAFHTHFGIDWEYAHWVWEVEFDSYLGRIEYYIDINTGGIIKFEIYEEGW